MDPKGQIQKQQQLIPIHSSFEDHKFIYSLKDSLSEHVKKCKKMLNHSSNDQEITKRKGGKHCFKYAKISNDQREGLIKQIISTGCTIKSAAQKLGINFSTAKAIMQIFKKEGRSCKKVIRKNKKRQTQMYKRHSAVTKGQSIREVKEQFRQTDEIKKEMIQQPISVLEAKNNQQLLIIQQLSSQNLLYQGQVVNLVQENAVLNQNYQNLCQQYEHLQNMVQKQYIQTQQILMKTQSPIAPFNF
ncbi:unnamed protein product [Paramecium octaurelia]|uniref:Uncharacterized protein n=1 Tax=Paramecium octaurelia TaxID=43137 RepID=A0A8S1XE44_PAROT|nr:unnamed protein product [Paramecium octaurelia]CAD8199350.1 unnamed protein product [Paramecium octaurelia]